jgi:4-hydroxythreonine-4-phosphate dehydrogenase
MVRSKNILITSGDPAGCGPYITLKALSQYKREDVNFFVVGDSPVYESYPLFKKLKKRIVFIDASTKKIKNLRKGVATRLGGKASLNYLQIALDLYKELGAGAIVTAPVSKEAVGLNLSGFCGHTEFLASRLGASGVAMLMVSRALNVSMLTRHIPVADIDKKITKKSVVSTLFLVHDFFKKQRGLEKPRIAVTGINPHAGVNTFMGAAEKKIAAAIAACDFKVQGPLPADTLFIPKRRHCYDCIICAYHDQAMIPFKLLSFGDGVNVTLGLPIVRTSPAHGVAYDLTAKGEKADCSSMLAAIDFAVTSCRR